MIDDRISANALCFPGADWTAMTATWTELGMRRISFTSRRLPADIAAAAEWLRASGHAVESITHPFLSGQTLDADADVIADARAELLRLVAAAEQIGAQSIYLVTGGRGLLGWEAAAERFSEAIAPGVRQAEAAGVHLLTEPVASLYSDFHIATSLHDTAILADMAGLGICLDIFACWTEANLEQQIRHLAPKTHLVQISDYVIGDRRLPARAVPGDGDIPLTAIVSWLTESGFAGGYDIEIAGPRIDDEGPLAAVRRTAEYVSALLAGSAPR